MVLGAVGGSLFTGFDKFSCLLLDFEPHPSSPAATTKSEQKQGIVLFYAFFDGIGLGHQHQEQWHLPTLGQFFLPKGGQAPLFMMLMS